MPDYCRFVQLFNTLLILLSMDEIYNRTNSLSLEMDEIIDRRNVLPVQYVVRPVRLQISSTSTTPYRVLAKGGGEGTQKKKGTQRPPTHFPIFVFPCNSKKMQSKVTTRWFIKAHLSRVKSGIRPIRCI